MNIRNMRRSQYADTSTIFQIIHHSVPFTVIWKSLDHAFIGEVTSLKCRRMRVFWHIFPLRLCVIREVYRHIYLSTMISKGIAIGFYNIFGVSILYENLFDNMNDKMILFDWESAPIEINGNSNLVNCCAYLFNRSH